jgi:hypothetical protein
MTDAERIRITTHARLAGARAAELIETARLLCDRSRGMVAAGAELRRRLDERRRREG